MRVRIITYNNGHDDHNRDNEDTDNNRKVLFINNRPLVLQDWG